MSYIAKPKTRAGRITETLVLGLFKKTQSVIEEFNDYRNMILFRRVVQLAIDNILGEDGKALLAKENIEILVEDAMRFAPHKTDNSIEEIAESVLELAITFWTHYRYEIRNRYLGCQVAVVQVELQRFALIIHVEVADV